MFLILHNLPHTLFLHSYQKISLATRDMKTHRHVNPDLECKLHPSLCSLDFIGFNCLRDNTRIGLDEI